MKDHRRVTTNLPRGTSRTKQSFKTSADINTVIARHTAMQPQNPTHVIERAALYADVSEIGDYHSSLNKVLNADRAFMTLPAKIRARFNNDPAQLIDFLSDQKNEAEAIQLGIVPRPEQIDSAKHQVDEKIQRQEVESKILKEQHDKLLQDQIKQLDDRKAELLRLSSSTSATKSSKGDPS